MGPTNHAEWPFRGPDSDRNRETHEALGSLMQAVAGEVRRQLEAAGIAPQLGELTVEVRDAAITRGDVVDLRFRLHLKADRVLIELDGKTAVFVKAPEHP